MNLPSTHELATWGVLLALGAVLGLYVRGRTARKRTEQLRRRALRWMGLCLALVAGLGIAVAILASPALGFFAALGFLVVLQAGAGFVGHLRSRSRPYDNA